jgi:beta-aspartyl-peptidase (threonine type)
MKSLPILLLAALASAQSLPVAAHEPEPVLVIHGGAGATRQGMTPQDEAAVRKALEAALRKGHEQLAQGRPAIDAVVAAIVVLEDDPNFNAGKGAVFTHEGVNELDASLMNGATLAAGAVAGVRRVRSPISLARAVMEASPHVMMVGPGAEAFAREQDLELVDPSYFRTEKRWQQLQKALEREAAPGVSSQGADPIRYFGTVGAVALDSEGRLAAGTSTGGMTNKRYGRVGDAPVIGAGTYANARCAVSGTGWGEYYLRTAAAHDICARMEYLNETARQAGEAVINQDIPALQHRRHVPRLDRGRRGSARGPVCRRPHGGARPGWPGGGHWRNCRGVVAGEQSMWPSPRAGLWQRLQAGLSDMQLADLFS